MRAVRLRTYKVRYGYKRDLESGANPLGNGAVGVRLWTSGILQVKARSKAQAELEGFYFLKAEFPRATHTVKVFSVELRKRGGR